MNTNRELLPHELARRDQLLAQAADDAAQPLHHVVIIDDAEGGTVCSLCDCQLPDDNPASHNADHCAGCPEPAEKIVTVEYRAPNERRAAVCAGHLDRGLQIIRAAYKRAYPDVNFGVITTWREPE
jgi:hypothetical protein